MAARQAYLDPLKDFVHELVGLGFEAAVHLSGPMLNELEVQVRLYVALLLHLGSAASAV